MTLGKASLLIAGLAGSMAVGVWIAPHITDRDAAAAAATESTTVEAPAPVRSVEPSRAERATMTRIAAVAPTAPALHERLDGVLAQGTDAEKAAEGFSNAEQFATLAHLARNTEVPFVLLKHRVLNEGKSMATAVKMSKPAINAPLEVNRARAAARSDIWSIGS
jgi:hypothetical protein